MQLRPLLKLVRAISLRRQPLELARPSLSLVRTITNCYIQDPDVSSRDHYLKYSHHTNFIQKRFKKRGKKSKQEEEESESEDDDPSQENPLLMDDNHDENSLDSRTIVIDVNSLRLDIVIKSAMSVTRARVEEAFYNGDILVNGERPDKKSDNISLGDEIDLIKNINPDDHTMVDVKRVQIVGLPDKASNTGRFKVKVKSPQELTIKAPEAPKDDH